MTEFDALRKEEPYDSELVDRWRPGLRESALFDRNAIHEIHRMAREGIYDIRGFGAKRRVPHFDDLLFLGASVSRYPLEGYRERCATDVTMGARIGRGGPRDRRPRVVVRWPCGVRAFPRGLRRTDER